MIEINVLDITQFVPVITIPSLSCSVDVFEIEHTRGDIKPTTTHVW